ncbi:MAG: hypothetical protein D6772_08470, partial [Bacteroidetes bacterium]
MRYLFLLLLVLGGTYGLTAQTYESRIAEARDLYRNGKYRKSGRILLEAFTQRSPRTTELNLALRALASAKLYDEAFAVLEEGINSGWLTLNHLLADPALEALYDDPRWDAQIQRLARFSVGENHELRQRLATIAERDQYYRLQMAEIAKTEGWNNPVIREMYELQQELDSLNYLQIDTIIATYGYPGRSMVGPLGSTALLVIQRAPLAEQLKHLPELQAAADKGELLWSDLALLIDKLKMRQGEPQVYGTQVVR